MFAVPEKIVKLLDTWNCSYRLAHRGQTGEIVIVCHLVHADGKPWNATESISPVSELDALELAVEKALSLGGPKSPAQAAQLNKSLEDENAALKAELAALRAKGSDAGKKTATAA